MVTSGLRIGTPAVTSLGMDTEAVKEIAAIIKFILEGTKAGTVAKGPNTGKPSKIAIVLDESVKTEAIAKAKELLGRFLLYPELDLDILKGLFC